MTSPAEYKQQIEAGKEIVKAILRDLATSLGDQRIANLAFVETHSDFDNNVVSLLDPSTEKIVVKLRVEDLADAPATSALRKQLEQRVKKAVTRSFKGEVRSTSPKPGSASFGASMELDVLLPIANRRAYEEQLSHYAAAATENNPLSLVLVDVDHFKSFNDNHGHEVGDSVLVEIAKVLRAVTTGQGDAFRYGGEELVMLLPNHTLREAESVAERARRSIESIQLPGLDETITASFGVATLPQTTTDASQFFKQADEALYTSKNDGRNRVACAELSGESKSAPKKQRYLIELSLAPLGCHGAPLEPRIPFRWFMLGLRNSGTALAKYPMIRFDAFSGLQIDQYGVDGNLNFGLPQRATDGNSIVFQGGADDVIFPNEIRQIAKLKQPGAKIAQKGTSVVDPHSNLWRTLDCDTWVFKALTFSCEVSCEGSSAVKNQISLPEECVNV